MTKEQEEAIERLNRFKAIKVLYGSTFAITIEQLKVLQEDIETVLSMLKEKDTELEKKDKINKLLIDFIYRMSIKRPGTIMYDLKEDGFDTSQCGNCKDKSCKECIKQYFGSKVKK